MGSDRSGCIARDLAAWLYRQLTLSTLRELAAIFGLGHADSVRNLTRRIDRALLESRKFHQAVAAIRQQVSD
jgi:chromosomal replication initiation ATPase DnaA